MSLLHEESRFELVTRWLVWLGVTYAVYNVDNTHQCFNEKPRAIIRPFKEVSNFYGCVRCGKYHFCFHSRHTCDSIAPTQDINNNMPTCVYSGRVILNSQNEVVGNYADIVALNSDIQNHISLTKLPGILNTISSSPTATMDARRLASYESLVNANSIQNKKTHSPNKRERSRIEKQDVTTRYLRHRIEKNDTTVFATHTDDDECKHGSHTPVIADVISANRRFDREAEMTAFDNIMLGCGGGGHNDDDEEYYGCDVEDGNGGGEEDWIEEDTTVYDDRLTRMKNPHNNDAFWDTYYAFLIHGEQPLLMASMDDASCDNNVSHIDATPSPSIDATAVFRIDETRWTNEVRETIEEEIRRIIDILLRASVAREQKTIQPRDYVSLLTRLTAYYHNIVCNIAVLVYHSPHTERLALEKYETNDKQSKSSHSNKVSLKVTDISAILDTTNQQQDTVTLAPLVKTPHRVIGLVCPKKMCAALMLRLFTDDFRVCDSMTNNICIWTKDPWLSYMKLEVFGEIIVDTNRGDTIASNQFDKREIGATATLINEALMTYSKQPMWLCSVVHNMKCR